MLFGQRPARTRSKPSCRTHKVGACAHAPAAALQDEPSSLAGSQAHADETSAVSPMRAFRRMAAIFGKKSRQGSCGPEHHRLFAEHACPPKPSEALRSLGEGGAKEGRRRGGSGWTALSAAPCRVDSRREGPRRNRVPPAAEASKALSEPKGDTRRTICGGRTHGRTCEQAKL